MAEKCCGTCEHWTRQHEDSRLGNCYWPIPDMPIWVDIPGNGEDMMRDDDGLACPVYSETSTPN